MESQGRKWGWTVAHFRSLFLAPLVERYPDLAGLQQPLDEIRWPKTPIAAGNRGGVIRAGRRVHVAPAFAIAVSRAPKPLGNMPRIVEIFRLTVADGPRLRAIRLRAIRDAPYAFGSTYEASILWSDEAWTRQLTELVTFVAIVDGRDVGMVRCGPDENLPDAAALRSMWVAHEERGHGVGDALIAAVVSWTSGAGFRRILLDVVEQQHRRRRPVRTPRIRAHRRHLVATASPRAHSQTPAGARVVSTTSGAKSDLDLSAGAERLAAGEKLLVAGSGDQEATRLAVAAVLERGSIFIPLG